MRISKEERHGAEGPNEDLFIAAKHTAMEMAIAFVVIIAMCFTTERGFFLAFFGLAVVIMFATTSPSNVIILGRYMRRIHDTQYHHHRQRYAIRVMYVFMYFLFVIFSWHSDDVRVSCLDYYSLWTLLTNVCAKG